MDQLEQQRQDRDQEQDKLMRHYIKIPFEVMLDDRLTLADKFVYGRALCFHEFFESVERTAAFIGISITQAQKSKQKLEKLGLIHCIEDNGRGKKYLAELEPSRLVKSANRLERLAKTAGQLSKKDQAGWQNLPIEIKEREKRKHSLKESAEAHGEQEKEQKTFGNPQVNELMADWTDATGFDHSKIKSERYAMAGLIKQHGYEATKALVRRVKAATRSGDPFAPQIAKASQLRGKYSKLEALVQWERRTQAKAAAEEAKKPAAVPVGLYPEFKPDPYDDIPDTPEAKAQRHATAQALREKYGFGRRAE